MMMTGEESGLAQPFIVRIAMGGQPFQFSRVRCEDAVDRQTIEPTAVFCNDVQGIGIKHQGAVRSGKYLFDQKDCVFCPSYAGADTYSLKTSGEE